MKMRNVLLLFVLPMLFIGGCSCTNVGPNEYGVVVYNIGEKRGEVEPVSGGFRFVSLGNQVRTFPRQIQRVAWTQSEDDGSPTDQAFRVSTSDQSRFVIDVGFSYRIIDHASAINIFKNYRTSLDVLTDGFVRDQVRKAVVETAGGTRSDSLLGPGIANFQRTVTTLLEERLTPLGFEVSEFAAIRVEPADESVARAIASRSAARQQAIQREEELRAALAQARTDSVRAAAQANQNRLVQQSITPQVLERMRLENERLMLEKWDGKLPTTIHPQVNPFTSLRQ